MDMGDLVPVVPVLLEAELVKEPVGVLLEGLQLQDGVVADVAGQAHLGGEEEGTVEIRASFGIGNIGM